jgi:hypothetical protein
MKIIENILDQLTDTDTLLESVYQAIAEVDPDYADEMAAYEQGVQALLQEVPGAESYLQARRQEFASDIRFAMWQGFMWNVDCRRDPIYKLLAQLDFEDLCRESQMHTLPAAKAAQATARAFTQSLPEALLSLLDPIIDHFAYLETYGYKLAHNAGFRMANNLLSLVVPGYVTDAGIPPYHKREIVHLNH